MTVLPLPGAINPTPATAAANDPSGISEDYLEGGDVSIYDFASPINVPLTGVNASLGGSLTQDAEVLLTAQTDPDENGGYHYDFDSDTLISDGLIADPAHAGRPVLVKNGGQILTVKPDGSGGYAFGDFVSIGVTTGLFAGQALMANFIPQLEAFLDRRRLCDQIVTPEAVAASGAGDIDTLAAGPVAEEDQPLDIFSNPLGKGKRVVFLSTGASSLGGAWYGTTDESTGQLRVDNYPVRTTGYGTNALVGGCMAVAPGVIAIYDSGTSGLAAILGADDTTEDGTWVVVKSAA